MCARGDASLVQCSDWDQAIGRAASGHHDPGGRSRICHCSLFGLSGRLGRSFSSRLPNESLALESDEDRYLGYVDGDNTEATVVGGPFADEYEALRDVSSYVDG